MGKKKIAVIPSTSEIHAAAHSAMLQTAVPVTAKQLAVLIKGPFKVTEAVLLPVLDESVSEGLLHIIPAATAKGKLRYWVHDLVEYGRLLILETLSKKGPQPKPKLKTAAKGLSEDQFQQAIRGLLDAHGVCEHPPVGKSKVVKYGTTPPAPEPYLKDVETQLIKVVRQLTEAGVSREILTQALLHTLAQAGISVDAVSANSLTVAEQESANGFELLMLIRQIEPGAERGALITARELRRVANLEKPQFDQAVIGLAKQGKLMLHRHDFASGLSPTERDELVTDGAGTYYVGMALRQNQC